MTECEEKYIEYNLKTIEKLINVINSLNRYVRTGFFDERDNQIMEIRDELPKLKTALLATLLSSDYYELCESSINIGRRLRTVNFPVEISEPTSLDSGFQIFELADYAIGKPRLVLKEIRNAIAHSFYSYDNNEIYLNSGRIKAVLTTEYFEEMMVKLFSESNRERKKGATLEVLLPLKKKVTEREEYLTYFDNTKKIEFEIINNLTSKNLYDVSRSAIIKVLRENSNSFESVDALVKCLDEKIGEDVRVTSKSLPSEMEYFFDAHGEKFAEEELKSQNQILEDMNKILSENRSKDRLAYETIFKIVDSIDEFGVDYRKLEKSGVLYYLTFCQQLLVRTHMNMAFNYSINSTHNKNGEFFKLMQKNEASMIWDIRNSIIHGGVNFENPFVPKKVVVKLFEKDKNNKTVEKSRLNFETDNLLGMGLNIFDKYKTYETPRIPRH